MSTRVATLVALVAVACARAQANAAEPLTLDEAFTRVELHHPALAAFRPARASLDAETERAAQPPVLAIEAGVENALGSGDAEALDGAELTLGLASVIERAGKREARIAIVERRRDALATAQAAKRLDLLAEVARRYLDIAAAQAEEQIADSDVDQRERALVAANRRAQAGASPASAALAAQANVARAELERERARHAQASAAARLAVLWGGPVDAPMRVATTAPALPDVPAFAELDVLLDATPELRRYANEERLREARVQLARSEATSDIEWRVGVRRLQASADWGLVGSVSIPFGTRARASAGIRSAEAERDVVALDRAAGMLDLRATLLEAHARLEARVLEATRLRDDVIPRFVSAESAAERAYRAGALSQLEWAQLQADTIAMRRLQLAATVDAQRALIEIQRLTGHAFGAAVMPARSGHP